MAAGERGQPGHVARVRATSFSADRAANIRRTCGPGAEPEAIVLVGGLGGNRNRRQRRPLIVLLIVNVVSITGNVFTTLAVPWFVLATTGSVTRVGIAAGAKLMGGTGPDRRR